MIKKMSLFYVVDAPKDRETDAYYVAGPFRTWSDARDAKRKIPDEYLLGLAEQIVHVEVD